MTALFGTAAISDSKNLVQFRAGKMSLKGTTVTADKRKGLVYVFQSDDSLMHFCWKDRTSGTLEDDLIIFPDDTEFKKLSQCTTGRAFILKFKSSSRKFFFWMQEPKDDKDEELCKKVNDLLNNPPDRSLSSTGDAAGASGLAGLQPQLASLGDQLGDSNIQRMLSNMDQNQLMQLLGMTGMGAGGAGGSGGGLGGMFGRDESRASSRSATNSAASATPAPSATPAASGNTSAVAATPPPAAAGAEAASVVQLSDLQNILSNIQTNGGGAGQQQESVDLSTSFSYEALVPLLQDKSVCDRLAPFLPEVKDLPADHNELSQTLQSAQFKQALSIFSAALSSGQLGPLMNQFKLPTKAVEAANKGDVVAFAKALQESEQAKDVVDEDMALD